MSPGSTTDRPADEGVAIALDGAAGVSGVMRKLLETADVSKVFGEPIHHGESLLLPTAELLSVAGFGMGSGRGVAADPEGRKSRGGGGGGGGGGRILTRAVAVIVSTPEGVEVRPVLDFTKIALAALTAAGFVMAAWKGMKRPRGFFGD
jgi:uncharacterized spore protein YtfJ